MCMLMTKYRGIKVAVSEDRTEQPTPEESGADGTQSEEMSADTKGSLVVSPAYADLAEFQIPEVLSSLQTKHPRLFGGEVSGVLMHTLQSVVAERSEQREIELHELRREAKQLTEELTSSRIENSVLKEKISNLRDRAKVSDVVIAAGGILFTVGFGWSIESPSSLAPWGVGVLGLVLLLYGFSISRQRL